jgi:outer membrane receptor for ferric coprogen and ferric-rhodotorulic acid
MTPVVVEAASATLPATVRRQETAKTTGFDIPALPLAEALKVFASVTGVRVDVDPSVIEGLQGRAVTGRMTAEEALRTIELTGEYHNLLRRRAEV